MRVRIYVVFVLFSNVNKSIHNGFIFFFPTFFNFQQLTTALSQEGRHDTVSDLVELSSLLEEVRQQEDFVLEERKENEKIQKKVDAAMADIEGT